MSKIILWWRLQNLCDCERGKADPFRNAYLTQYFSRHGRVVFRRGRILQWALLLIASFGCVLLCVVIYVLRYTPSAIEDFVDDGVIAIEHYEQTGRLSQQVTTNTRRSWQAPINPQGGTVYRVYNLQRWMDTADMKKSLFQLQSMPSVRTMVDKSDKFALHAFDQSSCNVGMWEGFLKCKRKMTVTFILDQLSLCERTHSGYSMWVNGNCAVPASCKQTCVNVDMMVGFNKIQIVCQFDRSPMLNISYKPMDSLSEARPIAPKSMFYNKNPEADW